MLDSFIKQLKAGDELSAEQTHEAVNLLIDSEISAEKKADFLEALAIKGETDAEIGAFASHLRDKSIAPPLDSETRSREILDVCGSGGDHQNTYNISTTVALLCSAAGVTVAKHGNRAITSKSGSADALEALGIRVDLPPELAAKWLKEVGFAFLFAPNYHPTFKNIAPARKLLAERKQRTIFNFLGPLLNPARPSAQLIGVSDPLKIKSMSNALRQLGARRGMVVCGQVNQDGWMDELSPFGPTKVAEYYQERGFHESELSPAPFPFRAPYSIEELQGGDASTNAEIIRRILTGAETGFVRDMALFNTGAALFVSGKSKSIFEGWELAQATINSGAASQKLSQLIEMSK